MSRHHKRLDAGLGWVLVLTIVALVAWGVFIVYQDSPRAVAHVAGFVIGFPVLTYVLGYLDEKINLDDWRGGDGE